MLVCSICANTDGPFVQEPTGRAATPHFVKCSTCAQKYIQISFTGTAGPNPSEKTFNEYFHECPQCHSLYYGSIPYAFFHYSVEKCPVCQRDFPDGSDMEFENTGVEEQEAIMSGVFKDEFRSLDHLKPIYEKLVKQYPKYSKVFEKIMLVETKRGNDIWVITKGSDMRKVRNLQSLIFKLSDKAFSFSNSQRFKFAKSDIVKIIDQVKV